MQREFQFYIVPTPIGNMSDITFRAVEILKSVDYIACEDTRTTQNILNHYDIRTKTFSYHKFNEKSKVSEILSLLNSGKKIALVSDAGTPMICDPGNILIKELVKNDISVTSLAGACTIPVFLSQIPRDGEEFSFIGFFPKTDKLAKDVILKYAHSNMVFYESPKRIIDTLKLIKSLRGSVNIALGRELTKLYEEIIVDDIDNVIDRFDGEVKGEIICMVYPSGDNSIDIKGQISKLKSKGYKSKDIATILSTLNNMNKNEIYKLALEQE